MAAAADWLDAVDTRRELIDSSQLHRVLEGQVAPESRSQISDQLAQAADQLAPSSGQPAPTVRSAPLGYRIVSFSRTRTVIATWEVVARSSLTIPPSVLWARSQLTLVWQDGWKVSGTRVRLDDPAGLTAADMANLDHDFAAFRHAP